MKIDTISEIYHLISGGIKNNPSRKESIVLRKAGLEAFTSDEGFTKIAFDTRRIDQETEYNPRRGLQNYNRSEAFLSQGLSDKLINLSKLKRVLASLKLEYGKEHEWQDSYARVLLSTLDKGLRTDQMDGDFSEAQPSMGSLDYIEELLDVRYRLRPENLSKMSEADLKHVILSKDEELTRKDVNKALEITKHDIGTKNYDSLMDKLFDGVRATAENKSVERTVTITIRDTYLDEK